MMNNHPNLTADVDVLTIMKKKTEQGFEFACGFLQEFPDKITVGDRIFLLDEVEYLGGLDYAGHYVAK